MRGQEDDEEKEENPEREERSGNCEDNANIRLAKEQWYRRETPLPQTIDPPPQYEIWVCETLSLTSHCSSQFVFAFLAAATTKDPKTIYLRADNRQLWSNMTTPSARQTVTSPNLL